jgi:hypothetical protein
MVGEEGMVVHCGTNTVGTFVHSLVLTDVASGWTECVAMPVREQALIVEAITGLRPRLPFPLLGLDTDNDSAFMNDTLWEYCQKHGIVFTRSRAYRKNDQAWVEQKNGAIVRKLIGYGRLEGLSETAALRRLYESSRLYINFFQPSFKLKSKTREGARVHKKYELPETPCGRLLLRDDVSSEIKEALKRQMGPLDPVLLLKSIREAQDMLMALSKDRTPETSAPDASTRECSRLLDQIGNARERPEGTSLQPAIYAPKPINSRRTRRMQEPDSNDRHRFRKDRKLPYACSWQNCCGSCKQSRYF